MPDDDKDKQVDQEANSEVRPPEDLAALESVAKGYKYYLDYLKNGGTSGITGNFGKLDLTDLDLSLLEEEETDS